jgi:Xaa-Pro aminopeptidase
MKSTGMPVERRSVYDVPPSDIYADFMKTGPALSSLDGITQDAVIPFCSAPRSKVFEAFTGLRVVIPSRNSKVRSNDTDYRFRPHSAFVYYIEVKGE